MPHWLLVILVGLIVGLLFHGTLGLIICLIGVALLLAPELR